VGAVSDYLDYIRTTYGVPAYRGGIVLVKGVPGTITGSSNARVRIRLQGEKHAHPYHPRDPDIVYEPRIEARTPCMKLDGLGRPIVDDADYYVQDRRQFVGNCVLWWCANSAGYACALDEAGVYKGSDVRDMRDTDVPWPIDVVLRNTRQYVDHQKLDHERERADATRRTTA
jgi:hypothetical protein